jgi:hypothetical protein
MPPTIDQPKYDAIIYAIYLTVPARLPLHRGPCARKMLCSEYKKLLKDMRLGLAPIVFSGALTQSLRRLSPARRRRYLAGAFHFGTLGGGTPLAPLGTLPRATATRGSPEDLGRPRAPFFRPRAIGV